MKTKPTQHSVKELQSVGIQPDILLCRSEVDIPEEQRRKIALFCNIRPDAVIAALDVKSIYNVPLSYHAEGFDNEVCRHFGLLEHFPEPDLSVWRQISQTVAKPEGSVKVAIVGKYTSLLDSYKSLAEALTHGGIANNIKVEVNWIDAEIFEKDNTIHHLNGVNGILVPGGFGERGAEGKIAAVKFARERKIPYLGICFGMQMAVIEAARNLLNIKDASSSEFGNKCTPVVGLLEEWQKGKKIFRGSKKDLINKEQGTDTLSVNHDRTIEILRRKKNIILSGPPGTGKTFTAKKIAKSLDNVNRILIPKNNTSPDKALEILDYDIEDLQQDDEYYTISTLPENFDKVSKNIENDGIEIDGEVSLVASNIVKVTENQSIKIVSLLEQLDEHDDIQKVHTNFEIE